MAPVLALGGAGFHPEAFAVLARLEAANFWFRARNRLIVWALRHCFPDMARFLEIGCGTGYVLSGIADAFPQAHLVGSEVISAGLSFASRRLPKAELLQMDARSIPYDSEFDIFGAFDVLEHTEEDEAVLVEMHRAIAPHGGIILTVPLHPWLWSQQDEYACHMRHYRVGELSEKVRRAGVRLLLQTAFVSLLLPAMVVSRLANRYALAMADPLAELRLPGLINRVFLDVMQAEFGLIRAGMLSPVGGRCCSSPPRPESGHEPA